jgi:hypothetical protein
LVEKEPAYNAGFFLLIIPEISQEHKGREDAKRRRGCYLKSKQGLHEITDKNLFFLF